MNFIKVFSKKIGASWNKTARFFRPKFTALNKKRKTGYSKFISFAKRRPILTFVVLLGLLLALVVLSNLITGQKEATEEKRLVAKEVSAFSIGEAPKITVQAQVEKSGVIKIVSLGSGVVQAINVEVGQAVWRGETIVSMSTNYQGGNVASVQRQLASVQYKNVLDTFDANKDIIAKQKELAEKNDKNADELRRINNDSVSSSQSLVDLNNSILSTLEAQQAELEATNVGGANDDDILAVKQMRSQLMAANNQLQSALRSAQYSGSDTNPPAELSNISKDIAIKQLEIQEKALALNKEVSRLNLVMAQISEAIMYPASPVAGVVERIYVRQGQALMPGTPIAQIKGDSQSLKVVALVSREIARGVSSAQVATIHLGDKSYEAAPFYVSEEATDGSLYSVQFAVPEQYSAEVTDKGYITIDLPVGLANTGSTVPFIPVDAVFQTQDDAFVFLAKNGKAQSRKVVLGEVLGRFVEVTSGLGERDQVILNRNVISGDPVKLVTSH